jgi:hypothetical protein
MDVAERRHAPAGPDGVSEDRSMAGSIKVMIVDDHPLIWGCPL